MLRAAFRGELFRTLRNAGPLFWGYGAIPLIMLLFALTVEIFVAMQLQGVPADRPFADIAVRPIAAAGNPIVHLFYAVGAATLFAGDYRWETWRLLVPRSRRGSLVAAKFLVYLLLVAASLFVLFAGTIAIRFLGQLLTSGGGGWQTDGAALFRVAVAALGSLLEAAAFGGLVACVAIASRSLTAAILLPFLLSLGVVLGLEYLNAQAAADLMLLVPTHAGDALRSWAAGGAAAMGAGGAAAALVALAAWTAVALAAAILLFARQDLARE